MYLYGVIGVWGIYLAFNLKAMQCSAEFAHVLFCCHCVLHEHNTAYASLYWPSISDSCYAL